MPPARRICASSAKRPASVNEYIPAQLIVIEDVCKKYSCECTVKTAGKPSQPIEKSTAGASLLTQVIVAKYADHLPLHRQAKIFSRFGVELSDRTMCGWMGQCAGLLDPLYNTLKDFVLSSKVVGTDDTPVKVLDRKLPQTRKGRIWPYVGDRDHQAVIYDYTPTRERAGPEEFLKGFRGHLQADAYVVYDSFFTDPARGRVEVGCWAHARRHFHNALEKDQARIGGVLAMIAHLYEVEKVSRQNGLGGEELRLVRERDARPMLNQLHEYLLTIRTQVLPKSDAGQTIAYTLKNWTALTRYCSDGDLPIDNNIVTAASGSDYVMPRAGLCRVSGARRLLLGRIANLPCAKNRHNHRPSRKESNESAGWKRSGARPEEVVWASARSLICMSACR